MVQVIDDIRNQEKDRRGQGEQLAASMRQHAASTNKVETAGEQDKAGCV
jgi:hypothetical protein